MKKAVLGIDIGVSSIGYVYNREGEIVNSGVFLLPSNSNDKFKSGNPNFQTENKVRNINRSSRRLNKRKSKKLSNLKKFLATYIDTKPLLNYDVTDLKIKGQFNELKESELYSILYNYAKYNGYNELYEDLDSEDSSSEYKKTIQEVEKWCEENNKTVSHYIKENKIKTHSSETPPIKSSLHKAELHKILEEQKKYFKFIKEDFINILFSIIYYRNPLKSSKNLRSNCKFEKKKKVVTKSNIIFQDFRIIKELHDLRINFNGMKNKLSQELLLELYNYLKVNEKLSKKDILDKILNKLKSEYEIVDKINDVEDFDRVDIYNKSTGEVLELNGLIITNLKHKFKEGVNNKDLIDHIFSKNFFSLSMEKSFIKGNHIRFQIQNILGKLDDNELSEILNKIYSENTYTLKLNSLLKSGIKKSKAEKIADLTFKKDYGSYSLKAVKKIMPYMTGEKGFLDEYDASNLVYPPKKYNPCKNKDIPKIKPNSLKNPVVERVSNHSIDIINYFANLYKDDDIKVSIELARSLKNSSEVRRNIFNNNQSMKYLREDIEKFLNKNKIKTSYKNIERVKLWLEQGGKFNRKNYKQESKAECIYTGKEIDIKNIESFEIEHTIPVSVFYDNSLSNKTLCDSSFNRSKDNKTAIEIIETFNDDKKFEILKRIDKYYQNNKYKRDIFSKYSNDKFGFPNSFLNNTSYINKELSGRIKERLDVIDSNGSVTDILKHITGASDLFINKVKSQILYDGKLNKRIDNRHHALDALFLSMTKRKYIKRLNDLNNTKGNLISAKFNKNLKIVKVLDDIKNDIYQSLNIKNDEEFNQFIDNFINNILVSIESEKDPVFKRNGSKGVRGALHSPNPKKKYFNAYIEVDEEFGKVNFKRSSKNSCGELKEEYDIDIENLNDNRVKSIIENSSYKSLKDAYLLDEKLIKSKYIKVKNVYYTNPKNNKQIEVSNLNIEREEGDSELKFVYYTGEKIYKKVDLKYKLTKDDIKSEHIKRKVDEYKDIDLAFTNDGYLKNLKEIKLKDRAENYIKIKGHIFESGNNYCFIVKDVKGKLKGSAVSLFNYINNDFSLDSEDLILKKKDFIVIGYDEKDIKKMIKKGDKSFYKNVYWINKIDSNRISITPHNFSSNADDSKIHKQSILKAISSIKNNKELGGGKMAKIKVDKFCNISI